MITKTFWKTIEPFLSDKVTPTKKVTLIDKEEIIVGDYNTAEFLNTFLSNTVSNLNIAEYSNSEPFAISIIGPVLKCGLKFRNRTRLPFSFSKINREEILREVLKLKTFKACQDTGIPTKLLKENADVFADILYATFNDSPEKCNLPFSFKKANITSLFKEGDRNSKDNYRPVSTLPNMSKIFERCIFCQLNSFMLEFLSKYQRGFRKGYSTQYCLLAMLEKWKFAIDKGESFSALLIDLFKGCDCLSKRHAYGFNIAASRLIDSYLTTRKQRTDVNMSYSRWEEILFGGQEGSILDPSFIIQHLPV